jgi:hypothetical protein
VIVDLSGAGCCSPAELVCPPDSRGGADTIRADGVGPAAVVRAVRVEVHGREHVQSAVLSPSTPGVYFGDGLEARQQAREVNEYSAEAVAARPERSGL